jgi:hypothetical protein
LILRCKLQNLLVRLAGAYRRHDGHTPLDVTGASDRSRSIVSCYSASRLLPDRANGGIQQENQEA